MKRCLFAWGLFFAVFFVPFSHAMAGEEESWAAVKALVENYDSSDEDVIQAIQAHLQKWPNGEHRYEAALWSIKFNTEFSPERGSEILIFLDELQAECKKPEVRAEALFWKAHVQKGMGNHGEARDLFARYLSEYPDEPRAAEVTRILKLEKAEGETRRELRNFLGSTLDRLIADNFSTLGMNIKIYPDSFEGKLALSRQEGLSLLAGNSWLRFSLFMGPEGFFVCLPEDKRIYSLNSPVHFIPNIRWAENELNLGFNLTESKEEKGSIEIDRHAAMASLEKLTGRMYIRKGSGNTFHFYAVKPRAALSDKPGTTLKFDGKGWVTTIQVRDEKGDKRVDLTKITDRPRVDKGAMTLEGAARSELSLDQLSFADAGNWFYKKLEKNKDRVKAYEDLWKNKTLILLYLRQFDSMFESARKAESTREKLAAVDQAIAAGPSDPANYDRKTGYLIELREYEKAEESLKQYERAQGDPAVAKTLLVRILIAKEDKNQAWSVLTPALEQYPASSRLWMQKAYLLQEADPGQALIAAGQANTLDPGDESPYYFLAVLLFQGAHYDHALYALNAGIEQARDKTLLIVTKGLFLVQLGETEEAKRTVQPVLDGPPCEYTAMAKMVELMVLSKESAAENK